MCTYMYVYIYTHNNMYNLQLLAMILILRVYFFMTPWQSTMVRSAELLRFAFSRCFHLGFEAEQKAKDADQRLQVMDDLLKEAMGEECHFSGQNEPHFPGPKWGWVNINYSKIKAPKSRFASF